MSRFCNWAFGWFGAGRKWEPPKFELAAADRIVQDTPQLVLSVPPNTSGEPRMSPALRRGAQMTRREIRSVEQFLELPWMVNLDQVEQSLVQPLEHPALKVKHNRGVSFALLEGYDNSHHSTHCLDARLKALRYLQADNRPDASALDLFWEVDLAAAHAAQAVKDWQEFSKGDARAIQRFYDALYGSRIRPTFLKQRGAAHTLQGTLELAVGLPPQFRPNVQVVFEIANEYVENRATPQGMSQSAFNVTRIVASYVESVGEGSNIIFTHRRSPQQNGQSVAQ